MNVFSNMHEHKNPIYMNRYFMYIGLEKILIINELTFLLF